jgi:hypothetical protein
VKNNYYLKTGRTSQETVSVGQGLPALVPVLVPVPVPVLVQVPVPVRIQNLPAQEDETTIAEIINPL